MGKWWGRDKSRATRGGRKKATLFRTDRGREITIDFVTGIGLFCLVALFAGVHEAPALPQPLAKTEAMLAESLPEAVAPHRAVGEKQSMASMTTFGETDAQPLAAIPTKTGDSSILILMSLVFSTLFALTFQFWRNLCRDYASPRRIRGRG